MNLFWSESESHSVPSDSLWPHVYTVHGILQARILEWGRVPSPEESSQPRDQTQVSLTAGDSLPGEPQGKNTPRILKCVAYCFPNGSFQPRNRSRVSCIAGRFFTNWPMREALESILTIFKNITYEVTKTPWKSASILTYWTESVYSTCCKLLTHSKHSKPSLCPNQ